MVIKSYGFRRGTRNKLKVKKQPTISSILRKFEVGDRVHISICGSFQKMPHPKFQGKTGKIISRRGNAYVVELMDLKGRKQVIVNPVHLKRQAK